MEAGSGGHGVAEAQQGSVTQRDDLRQIGMRDVELIFEPQAPDA